MKNDKLINENLEYELLNYWNDGDDLYVSYTVEDNEKDLKAHTIAYFNTSDIGCDYNSSDAEEIKSNLLRLLKENNGHEFTLPKVSELSPLLRDIYLYVCENDSNMCFIEENHWQELCEENNYSSKDLEKLEEEIKKYNLEKYITFGEGEAVICGYSGLQCCFNDDTIDRSDEHER